MASPPRKATAQRIACCPIREDCSAVFPASLASIDAHLIVASNCLSLHKSTFHCRRTLHCKASLRQTLEKNPSAEVHRRSEHLLASIEKSHQSPAHLRLVRAVEALERIGSPTAQAILRKVASGAPEASLTKEAKASLERAEQHGVATP
jgi:hypothetical protein